MKSFDFFLTPPTIESLSRYSAKGHSSTVVVLNRNDFKKKTGKKTGTWKQALANLPRELASAISSVAKARKFKPKALETLVFDLTPTHRVALTVVSTSTRPFELLTAARQCFTPVLETKPKSIAVVYAGSDTDPESGPGFVEQLVGTFTSAWAAGVFELPKYLGTKPSKKGAKKKDEDKEPPAPLTLFVASKPKKEWQTAAAHHTDVTGATNLVRRLTLMAGNDLTPSRYVSLAMDLAAKSKLKSTFHSLEDLEKMGAGAFLAVSRASDDRGGGILKLTYAPKKKDGASSKSAKHLVVAGKGICFDTGGANLKTGSYMFGMNGDMSGSAVALATVLLAAKEEWPLRVTAVMGITDNMIGPKGFRPNDIVKTMSGKTIEVIDTDAEGRMILSDTLHVASLEEPDLLLDYATLTGSCVRALGTRYSGVFSHNSKLYTKAVRAGIRSGERVWPFPTDEDYGKALKSEIADIKQCRVAGGPDHIEASYFLGQFVPRKTPWLHVDLSAVENEDGLAHVPSKVTGFGVRFACEMADLLLNDEIP